MFGAPDATPEEREAVRRDFARRIHAGEGCTCGGDIDACAAFLATEPITAATVAAMTTAAESRDRHTHRRAS